MPTPMSVSSPRLRHFARQAVVAATGEATPDAAQLRAAFDLLCDQLGQRLHPLFGELAIRALFARALHVAQAEFLWLTAVTPGDAGDRCALAGLDAVSQDLSPQVLADGLAAILAQEIELLSAFIGHDIVLPLVEQSWGAASLTDLSASREEDLQDS